MLLAALALSAQLNAGLTNFQRTRPTIEREVGQAQAIDLGMRLIQDREYLDITLPSGYSTADWSETVRTIVATDLQAIEDAGAGRRRPLSLESKGLYETFVPSSIDGTWLPVAVYVPPGASSGAPLALLLHGNPQSETELLGQPYFRRLADSTGTILVAPWGRGTYDYEGAAQTDVYDVLRAAQSALHTDARRCYLVGYSMGGFSVFKIGPSYPHWTAVMDIAGALLNSGVPAVRFAWRETPVYVVTGVHDGSIPSIYAQETAQYLAGMGLPAGLYVQPEGNHGVRTLMPSLSAAWADMHAGVIRASAVPSTTASLPSIHSIQVHDDLKP